MHHGCPVRPSGDSQTEVWVVEPLFVREAHRKETFFIHETTGLSSLQMNMPAKMNMPDMISGSRATNTARASGMVVGANQPRRCSR